MRWPWRLGIGLLLGPALMHAEEPQLKSRFVSLGLFKNGLAYVRKAVSVPGPGTYRLEEVPEPVHGTLWIESGSGVDARMASRVVSAPVRVDGGADVQNELAGCDVTIHFRDGSIPPATGKVQAVEPVKVSDAWDRAYQSPRYDAYNSAASPPSPGKFLVLDGPEGRTYVDSSMIAYLRAKGTCGKSVRQRKPVLLLTVPETNGKPAEIMISYLAKGVSWAPAYRVDISRPDTLTVEQSAVVKNELGDIENAEVSLISGFPNMQFAHVTSPFSLKTTWAQFFRQLNLRSVPDAPITSNVARQAVTANDPGAAGGIDFSAVPSGEGVDLHYQSIGRRTLPEGESLMVATAAARAPYGRIVEWIVPDTRNAYGRYIQDYERQQDPDRYQDAAWDAVRFKNPLPFPMTTAPAMIVSNGRFNGQRSTSWVNTGETTTLHVTRALSLRTHNAEYEEPGERAIVYVGGNDFRKVSVRGELRVNNHRKETVSLVIRRRFSGDLIGADGNPECALREEGVYAVNKRNELVWTLEVGPGEEKALAYRYSVLVDN